MSDTGYKYQSERPRIFTDEGQRDFLKIRDEAHRLLKVAGAFRALEVLHVASGDTFFMAACLDRLVELGEIVELPRQCWGQYRVFSSPQVHNA